MDIRKVIRGLNFRIFVTLQILSSVNFHSNSPQSITVLKLNSQLCTAKPHAPSLGLDVDSYRYCSASFCSLRSINDKKSLGSHISSVLKQFEAPFSTRKHTGITILSQIQTRWLTFNHLVNDLMLTLDYFFGFPIPFVLDVYCSQTQLKVTSCSEASSFYTNQNEPFLSCLALGRPIPVHPQVAQVRFQTFLIAVSSQNDRSDAGNP